MCMAAGALVVWWLLLVWFGHLWLWRANWWLLLAWAGVIDVVDEDADRCKTVTVFVLAHDGRKRRHVLLFLLSNIRFSRCVNIKSVTTRTCLLPPWAATAMYHSKRSAARHPGSGPPYARNAGDTFVENSIDLSRAQGQAQMFKFYFK